MAEPHARTGPDQPLGELVRDLARDVSTLVRQEIDLAKAETRQEVAKLGQAGGAFGVAGLAGWLSIIFVSLAAMFGLGALIPIGWAALIVAAIWGILAAVLALLGRSRVKSLHPMPDKTIETVKEDVRWLRNRNG